MNKQTQQPYQSQLLRWQHEMWEQYDLGAIAEVAVLGGGMFSSPRLITSSRGRFLLKGTVFRSTEASFAFQANLLDYLMNAGVACPALMRDRGGLFGCEHDGRFWAIYTYQPGRMLPWEEWHHRCRHERGLLEAVAEKVAKVHDALGGFINKSGDDALAPTCTVIQLRDIEACHEDWRQRITQLAGASTQATAAMGALLEARDEMEDNWQWVRHTLESLGIDDWPMQAVHGDVSPVNLVFDDDDAVLIDWDNVHFGHRIYDACGDVLIRAPHTVAFDYRECRPLIERYLQAYRQSSANPPSDAEFAAADVMLFLRQIEDLRQRLYVVEGVGESQDAMYANLIRSRLAALRQIRAER